MAKNQRESHSLQASFTASADIDKYETVFLHTDGTIRPVVNATTNIPIGYAMETVANGGTCLVNTFFMETDVEALSAAAINAGVLVKTEGTVTGGVPKYVAVGAAGIGTAITLSTAGAADAPIKIAFLRSPQRLAA